MILSRLPTTSSIAELVEEFRSVIEASEFPCVGAKSALQQGGVEVIVCDRLGSRDSASILQASLANFSARHPQPGLRPVSFVAVFREQVADEDRFHTQLWRQLQAIHDLDVRDHPWAAGVSDDPEAANFSFSVAARAFFVVGLHPHSSRVSRRAPRPTLVFNFHDQFEALRACGRYEKLQRAIRQRDIAIQGSINPMLANFGDRSEALQYSGRAGAGCPFKARPPSIGACNAGR